MREIRFRGKTVFTKKWVYGNLTILKHNESALIKAIIDQSYVDKDTVGQFTGRTAQVRDEIFEGDICIVTTFDHNGYDYQHTCVVIYVDGTFIFSNEKKDFYLTFWDIQDTDSDVEVIGNIHDNHELLGNEV